MLTIEACNPILIFISQSMVVYTLVHIANLTNNAHTVHIPRNMHVYVSLGWPGLHTPQSVIIRFLRKPLHPVLYVNLLAVA